MGKNEINLSKRNGVIRFSARLMVYQTSFRFLWFWAGVFDEAPAFFGYGQSNLTVKRRSVCGVEFAGRGIVTEKVFGHSMNCDGCTEKNVFDTYFVAEDFMDCMSSMLGLTA